MAAAPKQNLGKMPCPNKGCNDMVALKKSVTGKFSYACQDKDCEASGYVDQHGGAAKTWLEAIVGAPEVQEPANVTKTPVAPPAPTPAPAAKPPRVAFSLGSL